MKLGINFVLLFIIGYIWVSDLMGVLVFLFKMRVRRVLWKLERG